MKWTIVPVVLAVLLVGAVCERPACAGNEMQMERTQKIPSDLDLQRETRSKGGTYTVGYKVMGDTVPFNRLHEWLLSISGTDGLPVRGAQLTISNSMPGHPHGAVTRPRMTRHLKGGNYLIGGMEFNMKGWWKTTITIEIGGHKDVVEFNNLFQ